MCLISSLYPEMILTFTHGMNMCLNSPVSVLRASDTVQLMLHLPVVCAFKTTTANNINKKFYFQSGEEAVFSNSSCAKH